MPGEVKLKPCPFCGNDKKIVIRRSNCDSCFVKCHECGTEGPFYGEDDEAVAAWNRRAPEPVASDELFGKAIKASYEEGIEKGRESVKTEPGTSVIRWTRYDGTPETLPGQQKSVLLRLSGGDNTRLAYWFETSYTWHLEGGSVSQIRNGDLWAYLPEPPEGIK